MDNFKSQGRPTLEVATSTIAPPPVTIHKGLGASPIRLKVTVDEWVHLWRLWDKARNIGSRTEVDDYNKYAQGLLQKYDIVLKPGECIEFT